MGKKRKSREVYCGEFVWEDIKDISTPRPDNTQLNLLTAVLFRLGTLVEDARFEFLMYKDGTKCTCLVCVFGFSHRTVAMQECHSKRF
ncbi:Hypothetical predicted protein [Octopus vulgaris]|uniref:Uncharacterized protein n=1 Tax=Octopus vulgaris TaxID=6645 RepID=A0AA36B571_OCTVU|nr:Hypothetical predicted protein [Octopus vulgaris]